MATQKAAELGLSLDVQADELHESLLSLPKSASDVAIPEDAKKKIMEVVNAEAAMLAVGKGNIEIASALLKTSGVVLDKWQELEALAKAPYAVAKKAVEDAFRPNRTALETCKASIKTKINSFYAAEERAKQEIERQQKAEQDRIAKALAEKEAAAQKMKGAAKAKADAEAQKLRDEQARASVVEAPAPAPKPAGMASKTVYAFDIPEVGKIPERYLIKHEGSLAIADIKAHVLVQVDGALLAKDAAAGRLKQATWLKVTESTSVRAA